LWYKKGKGQDMKLSLIELIEIDTELKELEGVRYTGLYRVLDELVTDHESENMMPNNNHYELAG
jgi:hypothetical protein